MDEIGFCFLLVFACLNTVLGKRPEGITESPYHVVMESYLSSPWSPTVGEEDPGRRAVLSEQEKGLFAQSPPHRTPYIIQSGAQ